MSARCLQVDGSGIWAINWFESKCVFRLARVSFYDNSGWKSVPHVAEAEAIHHSPPCSCAGWWCRLREARMRHQGSVGALPQPHPSITTGKKHTEICSRELTTIRWTQEDEALKAPLVSKVSSSPSLSHLIFLYFLQCGQLWNDLEINTRMSETESGWLISWVADFMISTVFFHAAFLELHCKLAGAWHYAVCAGEQTSSRMLGRWMTLFAMSVCWLAGANAGVVAVHWLWQALDSHHQVGLDALRHHQCSNWLQNCLNVKGELWETFGVEYVRPPYLCVKLVALERRGTEGREDCTNGTLSVKCNDANNSNSWEMQWGSRGRTCKILCLSRASQIHKRPKIEPLKCLVEDKKCRCLFQIQSWFH